MIPYPDGTEARVGDAVALEDGGETGVVKHVLESAEEINEWTVSEPGLMIETTFGGYVFYPQRSIVDCEIAFISREKA